MIGSAFGAAARLVGVIDKAVQDKDLAAKLQTRVIEVAAEVDKAALTSRTMRWADALAKLILVTSKAMKEAYRPLGGLVLAGAAVYLQVKGVPTPPWLDAMLASAFPAWVMSRHVEKTKRLDKRKEDEPWSDLD